MSEEIVQAAAVPDEMKAAPEQNYADEFGREVIVVEAERPDPELLIVSRWQSERYRGFGDRLSTEGVAAALRAAEAGDLGAQMSLFQEMEERDPTLGSVMQTRRGYPLGLERVMQAATIRGGTEADLDLAQEIADECEEMIDQTPAFDEWMIDLFDAVGKGFSLSEKIYNADATLAGIKRVDPELLSFEAPDGALTVTFASRDDMRPIKIRCADYPWKWVIHRSKMRSGHPSRGGVLRTLVWVYVFRNYGLRDWSIFCERFGMPMRIGKYGPGATTNDKAVLTEMVEKMGSEAWAVISEKTVIEFKELMGRGVEPFSAFWRALGGEYALAVLGQTATTMVNEFGTRGDSAVKQLVRQDIGEMDCTQAEASLKRDILYPFVLARHGADVARRFTPTLHFRYEPPKDLAAQALVDRFAVLESGLGRFIPVDRLAERYGISDLLVMPDDPEYDPDLMVIGEAPDMGDDEDDPADPEDGDGEDGSGDDPDEKKALAGGFATSKSLRALDRAFALDLSKRYADRGRENPDQRQVDRFVDLSVEKADRAFRSLSAPIRALVAQSEDLTDLRERMRKAYEELPHEKLAEMIARATFAARLYGRATIADKIKAASRRRSRRRR
jgi:phage gp29-like protein